MRLPTTLLTASLLLASPLASHAADAPDEPQPFGASFQATYIWQNKPAFGAPYSGTNSLAPAKELSYSFTTTAFLGMRLGPDTEIYFNPELVQGVPMSRLTGLAGLTNGELQKTAGSNPSVYRARLFVRHTWGLGGEREKVEAEPNQLAGLRDKHRLVLTAGNLSVTDIFDDNAYAHDARTQFTNWSFLTHGAYDFAADSRGYSWGAALEYYLDDWAFRIGRFAQPVESNGLPLDFALARHYGDQIEIEKSYTLGGRPGTVRWLMFHNRAIMGGFEDALAYAAAHGTAPDVGPVRRARTKRGWGINLEQAVSDSAGVFLRWGRNDGAAETYAFAEIDRSLSFGLTVTGGRWGRASDTLGLAYARNGLSQAHRDFLAAGGYGFFVGDGRLNYRPESIVEGYYSIGLDVPRLQRSAVTVGFQHISNPAYNADRGPVKVFTVRLHTEF